MDPQLVQRTRYQLKSRVKYALSCPAELFQSACRQLLTWLERHPVFSAIVKQGFNQDDWWFLAAFKRTMEELKNPASRGLECTHLIAENRSDHAALCYFVIYFIAKFELSQEGVSELGLTAKNVRARHSFFLLCMSEHLIGEDDRDAGKALEIIRDVAVNGLYEYLDEQLDSRNALLGLLFKYKHRSEWFRRKRLREIAENGLEHKKDGGERALAIDLYEYVYDQGVEYTIEPASASGEADLVARDSDERYIVVDAKYIAPDDAPSVVKKKLGYGFHQVARYCEDHNEPIGYLVAYINHKATPRLPLEEADGFRYLSVKGKSVYYIAVDIGEHPSASKSGIAEEINISKEELLKEIEGTSATPLSP